MAFPTKTVLTVGIIATIGVAVAVAMKDTAAPNAQPSTAPAQAGAATNPAAPRRQLLFFMNPNGVPCQTQLGILNGVADSLAKVAQVVYIKTTVPSDMAKFERYGIRALPSLIIADADGREVTRLSPGIHGSGAVFEALSR